MLLQCSDLGPIDASRRPFRFHAMWTSHPEFSAFVAGVWHGSDDDDGFVKKHESLTDALKVWNREVFGNVF